MTHRAHGPGLPGRVTYTLLLLVLWAPLLQALELYSVRQSATDLEVSGLIKNVPESESRWLRWDDVRSLSRQSIVTEGEYLPGQQTVELVPLQDLLDQLPLAADADTVLADCSDGYTAVYTREFRARWKPFIVVTINGAGPADWPLDGMSMNPGPYVVSVSDTVAPGVGRLIDVAHKQPWATYRLRVVNHDSAFRSLYEGEWASLSPRAMSGRILWENSCHSCHTGPEDAAGGTKSARPFAVLRAHATHNSAWFMNYVRNPQAMSAVAQMTGHPHYSDTQLEAIIAFIVAEKPADSGL